MKNSKITIKFLFVLAFLVLVLSAVSATNVFAEPDETYAIESYVATDDEVYETEAEEPEITETEPTYRAPLPTVEDTEIPLPTVVGHIEEKEDTPLFWGFVSWILIGVGAAVVFAVVLSTKAKAYRGGRDRYSTTDKISGKKKLLSQDYYDNRKRR